MHGEDVDDSVLSDEALDQLDRELENVEEKQCEVPFTDAMTNGTSEKETREVVSTIKPPLMTASPQPSHFKDCCHYMLNILSMWH